MSLAKIAETLLGGMKRYFDSKIEQVKIRPDRLENTYNIEGPGFAGLNLPQNLESAQNEIIRLEILGEHGRATKLSKRCLGCSGGGLVGNFGVERFAYIPKRPR